MSEKAQLAKDAIKRRQGGGKSPSKNNMNNGGQSGLQFLFWRCLICLKFNQTPYLQLVLYIWESLCSYTYSANLDQEVQKLPLKDNDSYYMISNIYAYFVLNQLQTIHNLSNYAQIDMVILLLFLYTQNSETLNFNQNNSKSFPRIC
ncbi:unnamed protein product (macronuclear) [Paramecium tetraurelia]|uniref:Small EDRK-rich factor-like N-terminal domain-containing protein n=1 Tax=Paramecium tetraurelia TaxID=5888 RepID=A0ED90_PARTE|nr:uncharacterized protein GSPATT00004126001 [Paramecium tetraurelia]CAK93257.1 unnamed protein product [Paramecium tetraurelia]|eukprot:XP_001460654.1 hypothetical protein (macronuclear) [Paramecium tetraurelia strain d4-2]